MSIENKASQDRWHSIDMPKQEAQKRVCNFEEVALGYSEEQAQKEAARCLLCSSPQCSKGCPVGINVPGFIRLVKEKKYDQALKKIKEKSSFPIISCRICPQEEQCQKSCLWQKKAVQFRLADLKDL
jgi:glutamate synthase (NADPH) small chain